MKNVFASLVQSPPKLRSPRALKKGGGLRDHKPPLTATMPGEPSSTKADLDKCYKRIADLEIRVQDLTVSSNMVSR